jgi:hypothetical protein
MIQLGGVFTALRIAFWNILSVLAKWRGFKEASTRFAEKAEWNNQLLLYWEGVGPRPSGRVGLVMAMDLLFLIGSIATFIALAIWIRS